MRTGAGSFWQKARGRTGVRTPSGSSLASSPSEQGEEEEEGTPPGFATPSPIGMGEGPVEGGGSFSQFAVSLSAVSRRDRSRDGGAVGSADRLRVSSVTHWSRYGSSWHVRSVSFIRRIKSSRTRPSKSLGQLAGQHLDARINLAVQGGLVAHHPVQLGETSSSVSSMSSNNWACQRCRRRSRHDAAAIFSA